MCHNALEFQRGKTKLTITTTKREYRAIPTAVLRINILNPGENLQTSPDFPRALQPREGLQAPPPARPFHPRLFKGRFSGMIYTVVKHLRIPRWKAPVRALQLDKITFHDPTHETMAP